MLTEAISALKKLIKQADEPTLNTATLADGTQIKYPGELAVDTAITVVTAEGEVPAPDGDHTLEDGTIVKTKDGKVAEIVAAQAKTPVEQMKALQSKIEVKQATVEERLANLEAIAKVVMEYCYGWELRESKMEDAKEKAIEAYKALSPVASAAEAMVEQLAVISTLQSEVETLKAKPAAKPAIEVTEPLDPIQREVERIKSIQNKTRK